MEIKKWNYSIDVVKGILILLVILGHVILGTIQNNFIRFFIYTFHMPMFLFISGYLVNLNKLRLYSYSGLIKHYASRMLSWWLLAWYIFTTITQYGNLSLKIYIVQFIHPYYHLWYVPSVFFMICFIYIITKKIKFNNKFFWIIIFSWGILFKILSIYINIPRLCYLSDFIYFSIGLYCSNKKISDIKAWKFGWIIYTLATCILYLFAQNTIPYKYCNIILLPFVIMLLIRWLYPSITKKQLPYNELLIYCGQNSLHIYLWHVLPIIIYKHYLPNNIYYYLTSLLTFSLFLFYAKKHTISKSPI